MQQRLLDVLQRKYGTPEHLFEQRPWSAVVSENGLREALRHVELNPVRAGIVPSATEGLCTKSRGGLSGKALSRRERVADSQRAGGRVRAGFRRLIGPHPPLRGTFSRWEKALAISVAFFVQSPLVECTGTLFTGA